MTISQPPSTTPRVSRSYQFAGHDGRRYDVQPLTPRLVLEHGDALVTIHNEIPLVTWTVEDLLADVDPRDPTRPYIGKWELSQIVLHEGEPVAIMLAFLRGSSGRHPLEALYLHRFATRPDHRRNGLAWTVVTHCFSWGFAALPWLRAATLQTNDTPENQGVIELYRRMGFETVYHVPYADKVDVLMRRWRAPTDPAGTGAFDPSVLAASPFGGRDELVVRPTGEPADVDRLSRAFESAGVRTDAEEAAFEASCTRELVTDPEEAMVAEVQLRSRDGRRTRTFRTACPGRVLARPPRPRRRPGAIPFPDGEAGTLSDRFVPAGRETPLSQLDALSLSAVDPLRACVADAVATLRGQAG